MGIYSDFSEPTELLKLHILHQPKFLSKYLHRFSRDFSSSGCRRISNEIYKACCRIPWVIFSSMFRGNSQRIRRKLIDELLVELFWWYLLNNVQSLLDCGFLYVPSLTLWKIIGRLLSRLKVNFSRRW